MVYEGDRWATPTSPGLVVGEEAVAFVVDVVLPATALIFSKRSGNCGCCWKWESV